MKLSILKYYQNACQKIKYGQLFPFSILYDSVGTLEFIYNVNGIAQTLQKMECLLGFDQLQLVYVIYCNYCTFSCKWDCFLQYTKCNLQNKLTKIQFALNSSSQSWNKCINKTSVTFCYVTFTCYMNRAC